MDQLKLAQAAEIERLQKQNKVMRQLATREGFYSYYFKRCRTAITNLAAFNETNDLYFELFKEYRYADFNSFKVMTNYYNKKDKK